MTPSRWTQTSESLQQKLSLVAFDELANKNHHLLPSYNMYKIMILDEVILGSVQGTRVAPRARESRCNEPKPVRQKRRLRSEGALGHASNTRSTPTTSKGAPDRHRSATQATDTATSTYRHTAIQQPQPRARARARHVRLPKIDVDAADLVRSR